MKVVLFILGVFGVFVGSLWIGQGTGYVRWPASSFMIDETTWIWYGAAVVLVGLIMIAYSRRPL